MSSYSSGSNKDMEASPFHTIPLSMGDGYDSPGPPGVSPSSEHINIPKKMLLGVENARRRLKAFSIQKKQSSVVSAGQSPTIMTEPGSSKLVVGSKLGQLKKLSPLPHGLDPTDKKTSKKHKKESMYEHMVKQLNDMKNSDTQLREKYGEHINFLLQRVGLPSTDHIRTLNMLEMELLVNKPCSVEALHLVDDLKRRYLPMNVDTKNLQQSHPESELQNLVVWDSWSLDEEKPKDKKSTEKGSSGKSESKKSSNTGLSIISELYSPELSSNSNSPEKASDSVSSQTRDETDVSVTSLFAPESLVRKKRVIAPVESDVKSQPILPPLIKDFIPLIERPFSIGRPVVGVNIDKFGFLIRDTSNIPIVQPLEVDVSKDKKKSRRRRSSDRSRRRSSDRREDRDRRDRRFDRNRRDRDRKYSFKERDKKSTRHRKDDDRISRRDDDSKSNRRSHSRDQKDRSDKKKKDKEKLPEDSSDVKKSNDNAEKKKVISEDLLLNLEVEIGKKGDSNSAVSQSERSSNIDVNSSKRSGSNVPPARSPVMLPLDDKLFKPIGEKIDEEFNKSKLISEWENSQSPDYAVKSDTQWERSPTPERPLHTDDYSPHIDLIPGNVIIKDIWEESNESLEECENKDNVVEPSPKLDEDLVTDEVKTEPVDYWKDVADACGPYYHSSDNCYRKTKSGPEISYCENLSRCGCKPLLTDKFEKLSFNAEKIMQTIPHGQTDESLTDEPMVSRTWYPDENHVLQEKPVEMELETSWEKDDDSSNFDETSKSERSRTTSKRQNQNKEKSSKTKQNSRKESGRGNSDERYDFKIRGSSTVLPDDIFSGRNEAIKIGKDLGRSSFPKVSSLLDISMIPTPVLDPPTAPVVVKPSPPAGPSLDLEYEKFMEAVSSTAVTDEMDDDNSPKTMEASKSSRDSSRTDKSSRSSSSSNKKESDDKAANASIDSDVPFDEQLPEEIKAVTEECLDVSDIMEGISKKRSVKDKGKKEEEKVSKKDRKKKEKTKGESEISESKKLKKEKSLEKKKNEDLTKKRKRKKKVKKHKKVSSSSSESSFSSSSNSSDSSSSSSSGSSSRSDSSSLSSESSDEGNKSGKKKKKLVKRKTFKVSPKSKKKYKKLSIKPKKKDLIKKSKDSRKYDKSFKEKKLDKKKRIKGDGDKGSGKILKSEKKGKEISEVDDKGKTKEAKVETGYSSDEENMKKAVLAEKLRKAKKLKKKISEKSKNIKDKKAKARDRKQHIKKKKRIESSSSSSSSSRSGSSSSSESYDSEDDKVSRKSKKKRNNKRKTHEKDVTKLSTKKKLEDAETDENPFNIDTLLNIKKEKVSDDEHIKIQGVFSPRINRNIRHEIISVSELHNDFVQISKSTFEDVVIKTEKIDENELDNIVENIDIQKSADDSTNKAISSEKSLDSVSKDIVTEVAVKPDEIVEESILPDFDDNAVDKNSDISSKTSSNESSLSSTDDNTNSSIEREKFVSPIEDSESVNNTDFNQEVECRQNSQEHVSDASRNSSVSGNDVSVSCDREFIAKRTEICVARPFENIGRNIMLQNISNIDTVSKSASLSDVSDSSLDSNSGVNKNIFVLPDPTKDIIQSPVKKKPKYVGKNIPITESVAELEHKRRVVEELDRLKKEFEEFRQQKLKSNDSERQAAAEELKRQFDMMESYTLSSSRITTVIDQPKKLETQAPMTDIRPIPTVTGVSSSVGAVGSSPVGSSSEEGLLQGEIKWDWRPSSSNTTSTGSANRRPRPSRWGMVSKDQMQTNSTLIQVPIKNNKEIKHRTSSNIPSILDVAKDHHIHHADVMSDQEMLLMQAQYESNYGSHDDVNAIYKIPTISSVEVLNSIARSDHEANYEMYSQAQEMGYVTLPNTETSMADEDRRSKKISLDERINLVLRNPGAVGSKPGRSLMDDEMAPPSPPQLPPSLALRAPPPIQSKGILVLGSVKITRLDPRGPITKSKKVCFSDGLAPGMDSDLEDPLEPPKKKRKTKANQTKKKCGGHSYPCPSFWPDYHPDWDSLPPPPPPPGSPPMSLMDPRCLVTPVTVMNAPDAIITRLPRIPSHNETQIITN